MKITGVLQKHCICLPLRSTDKTAAITELVDVLADKCGLTDRDAVLAAVLAREKLRSTGVGRGLAVPHGKSRGCRGLTMAIGKPESPMPFDAVDDRPCQLIVLLASPVDETGPHIQALGSISRLWQKEGFRRAAEEAKTPDDLFAAIERHQV